MLDKKADVILPKLITNFLNDAETYQRKARAAVETKNAEELRRTAHTLKSNAKNFGAESLAELCHVIEQLAKTGNLDVLEWFNRVETEYARVKTALAQFCD